MLVVYLVCHECSFNEDILQEEDEFLSEDEKSPLCLDRA